MESISTNSARQLEALVRLAESHAKIRFKKNVSKKDAQKAIDLLEYCLTQVGLDKETGKIDIDRIATGISSSQRSHIIVLKETINELETKIGKQIPTEEVINEAKSKGIDDAKIEEAIERLKRSGDIYEPRRGYLSKL